MNTKKLDTLRTQLLTSDDFHAVMDWFHRELSSDPTFLAAGNFTEPGLLGPVLTQVARKVLGPSARIDHLTLIRLRDYPFVHGVLVTGGRPGNVIHFEEAQVGLVCIADARGKADYLRFRTFPVYPDDPCSDGRSAVNERPPGGRARRRRHGTGAAPAPRRPESAARPPAGPERDEHGGSDPRTADRRA
jgi:hypothetical protein